MGKLQNELSEKYNNEIAETYALEMILATEYGLEIAKKLLEKYNFTEDYLFDFTPDEIVHDIAIMETVNSENKHALHLNTNTSRQNIWQIKLMKLNDQVSLSRGLPIIENFGFKLIDEKPYEIKLENGTFVHICDFGVKVDERYLDRANNKVIRDNLCAALLDVFNRVMENDSLNKLVLFSGLTSRQIMLVRSINSYLVQTTLPFSRQYMTDCLNNYPVITTDLYTLFEVKFDLQNHDIKQVEIINARIHNHLVDVASLDDDRILRSFQAVVNAMIRTNYYQKDEALDNKDYISFKVESQKLAFLPKPLPLYEVFVYSSRFEAVHLRFGKVARGGFRWSDRREDFRTEVLGLVKAQVVKNSVIVPTGSKGGFYCKKLPSITNRESYMAEGIACYKKFIAGLLDITDNLVAGKVIPPIDVIRYDSDDPYLVAAADKGTATFSDYANEMSMQYGFWLGDAFASGGSVGYDHKKMGITARGAWEAAKRHFRHLNIDIQNQDFTVIGIGDMAGDVFGNGMLLSKHIKLLAAFNHQHIFLDPNPDTIQSFAERERLFNLPRSSWADYDKSKISIGGGVFERASKSIILSVEVKAWLQTGENEVTPNELIKMILKSHTDMLYNGGIGTYIKAETESNEMVKDKANDNLRINGRELNVRVVVEGGNLGVTQLGRIEFAKKGGAIYTDAIDNSAGVDCSDHEVNIKILFADIMHKTGMTVEKRNQILGTMTDDVAKLVLRDNYLQTEILRYASTRASELFSINVNFIEKLEKRGELDRAVEFLPGNQEIEERIRKNQGLTTPELSVLLAYSKIVLDREILCSGIPDGSEFSELLFKYFPKQLQDNYAANIENHYLRKEIIATSLANLVTNRMGITFISRFEDEFKTSIDNIIKAFWVVYKLVDAESVFAEIEALDNKVLADVQVELLIQLKKSLERSTRWLLRKVKDGNKILPLIADYHDDIKHLIEILPSITSATEYPKVKSVEDKLLASKVPLRLVGFIARTSIIPQLFDIVMLSRESKRSYENIATNYFYLGQVLRMDWLRKSLIALPENNKWQALSRSALLADGYAIYSTFVKNVINRSDVNDNNFAKTWLAKESDKIVQINQMLDELQSYKSVDLAMLSAAVRELGTILN